MHHPAVLSLHGLLLALLVAGLALAAAAKAVWPRGEHGQPLDIDQAQECEDEHNAARPDPQAGWITLAFLAAMSMLAVALTGQNH